MTNDYADACIRGVRKADWIVDGVVSTLAFVPDYKTKEIREDQAFETSINWEDDDKVISYTLNQPTSIHGALRLPRSVIDNVSGLPRSLNCLKYERKIAHNNPYHGNILFSSSLSTHIIRQIAGSLALGVTPQNIFPPKTKSAC